MNEGDWEEVPQHNDAELDENDICISNLKEEHWEGDFGFGTFLSLYFPFGQDMFVNQAFRSFSICCSFKGGTYPREGRRKG